MFDTNLINYFLLFQWMKQVQNLRVVHLKMAHVAGRTSVLASVSGWEEGMPLKTLNRLLTTQWAPNWVRPNTHKKTPLIVHLLTMWQVIWTNCLGLERFKSTAQTAIKLQAKRFLKIVDSPLKSTQYRHKHNLCTVHKSALLLFTEFKFTLQSYKPQRGKQQLYSFLSFSPFFIIHVWPWNVFWV